MDRRDYIMRMIEEAGRALRALRNRILGRDASGEDVLRSLRDTARQGGIDYDLARVMTSDTLAMMVAPDGEVEPGRCWVLAESFYLEGLEAELADRPAEARNMLGRAAFLFGLLRPVAGNVIGLAEADDRLAEIERRLDALPPGRGRNRAARVTGFRRLGQRIAASSG